MTNTAGAAVLGPDVRFLKVLVVSVLHQALGDADSRGVQWDIAGILMAASGSVCQSRGVLTKRMYYQSFRARVPSLCGAVSFQLRCSA